MMSFLLDSVADIQTLNLTTFADGQHFSVRCFHPNITLGGDIFYVDKTRPKSAHDGGSIVSVTVPWDGTVTGLTGFLDRTGETDANRKRMSGSFVWGQDHPIYVRCARKWYGR